MTGIALHTVCTFPVRLRNEVTGSRGARSTICPPFPKHAIALEGGDDCSRSRELPLELEAAVLCLSLSGHPILTHPGPENPCRIRHWILQLAVQASVVYDRTSQARPRFRYRGPIR
jgi:hypothetical protein